METCQRCKEEGSDRRTLWMACLYEMGELGLPFEQLAIYGVGQQFSHNDYIQMGHTGPGIAVPRFAPDPDAKQSLYKFFTLRVCKDCRADWMRAIKTWFEDAPKRDDGIEEGAAYVRDLGSTRRMTPDEIDAALAGRPD